MPRSKKQQSSRQATSTPKKEKEGEVNDIDDRVYCPTLGIAFRLLCIVRLYTALKATIPDCDEVYNYWEPTHYLQYGSGLQTWEYSPVYAIRSWAYIGLHALLGRAMTLLARNKIQVFYAIRFALVVMCAACEATFYRAVADHFNRCVARYLLVALMFSAGMAQAAPAFLPSTFAMYACMLAASYFLQSPTIVAHAGSRTLGALLCLAAGAAWGWPFSGAIGIPFAIEELFIRGNERFVMHHANKQNEDKSSSSSTEVLARKQWMLKRWQHFFTCVLVACAIVLLPLICIDSAFYRKWVIVPWNIVRYNVLGGEERGPDLYGTEPWWFYLANGLINFNLLWLLALTSIPLLIINSITSKQARSSDSTGVTSFNVMATIRLLPFYLWLVIFTLQAHKEERFLYPVYPLVCFNACVSLYFIRQLFDRLLVMRGQFLSTTQRHRLLSSGTFGVLAISSIISVLRTYALYSYYHAPMSVYSYLSNVEVTNLNNTIQHEHTQPLRVCVGKEWFRFPSSYFLPNNARLYFLRSHFRGLLPKYFIEPSGPSKLSSNLTTIQEIEQADGWRPGTWMIPTSMNDLNHEALDRYIDVEQCDYIIDVDFPHRYVSSPSSSSSSSNNDVVIDEDPQEPRYGMHAEWSQLHCEPYLDAAHTRQLSRLIWLPRQLLSNAKGDDGRAWGQYCLLRRVSNKHIQSNGTSDDKEEEKQGATSSIEHSEL
ncbi:Alg9-like mannosyltransferase family-domain-containing protein [Syncephalis plumigaleata]|nr:Alg9-like mannosyltransferase family-domain-containing protein [Syncephalis plumigaleata]